MQHMLRCWKLVRRLHRRCRAQVADALGLHDAPTIPAGASADQVAHIYAEIIGD